MRVHDKVFCYDEIGKNVFRQTANSLPSSNGSVHDSVVSIRHKTSNNFPLRVHYLSNAFRRSIAYCSEASKPVEEDSSFEERKEQRCIPETDLETQISPISSLLHELQGLRLLQKALKHELAGLDRRAVVKKMKSEILPACNQPVTVRQDTSTMPTHRHRLETISTPRFQKTDSLKKTTPECNSFTSRGVSQSCCLNRGSYFALYQKRQRNGKKSRRSKELNSQQTIFVKHHSSRIPKPPRIIGAISKKRRATDSRIPKPETQSKCGATKDEVEVLSNCIHAIDSQLDQIKQKRARRAVEEQARFQYAYCPSTKESSCKSTLKFNGKPACRAQ